MSLNLVVGLRGLARGNIHWGDFPLIFKKNIPKAHFVSFEMPGNGERSQENSLTDPLKAIEDLRQQLHRYQNQNPQYKNAKIVLVGVSLGGMLALKWCELFPGEIHQAFIVNSSLKQFSSFYHRLLYTNYFKVLKILLSPAEQIREKLILKLTSNDELKTQEYIPLFTRMAQKHPFKNSNFFRQLLLASKITISIPSSTKTKFIVICCQKDRFVDALCSKEIAMHLSASLITHETAGHDLSLDDPEWLVEQIAAYWPKVKK